MRNLYFQPKDLQLVELPLGLLVAPDQVCSLHCDLQQTTFGQHVRCSLKSAFQNET